jgi:hypothetical protein
MVKVKVSKNQKLEMINTVSEITAREKMRDDER